MRKPIILHVVGARPNFVKAAPLLAEAQRRRVLEHVLVHSGQHYSSLMSDVFFEDLHIPDPNYSFEVAGASRAARMSAMIAGLSRVVEHVSPSAIVAYGDVDTTLAAGLFGSMLSVPVVHIEAGLRSGDMDMPEERNRLVVDLLSSVCFVTEPSGMQNLRIEGVQAESHLVGNLMCETLLEYLPTAEAKQVWGAFGLQPRRYAVVTLHRPSNVDVRERLIDLLAAIERVQEGLPVIWVMHPRTEIHMQALVNSKRRLQDAGVLFVDPMSYLRFLSLQSKAAVVITDSGGIQEETTMLDVPCLTLRMNTERPITLDIGTNVLITGGQEAIVGAVERSVANPKRRASVPYGWDALVSSRVLRVLEERYG